MIDPQDLAAIDREGRRIIELGRRAADRSVPQYPSWTLRDLVIHVAGIHGRTGAICETLARERVPTAELPPDRDLFDWADEQLEKMLDGLRTADPAAVVWTFVPDPTLSFWGRRMVIETGVHRWDAEGAIGDPEPLLQIVAAHGLDEFPELYLPRLGDVPAIEMTAIDLGRSWCFGDGPPVASIEGTSSDLFLRLMSRPGVALPAEWERAVDALGSPADA
jgi:uncharacterized protein (TIGR03083 family)